MLETVLSSILSTVLSWFGSGVSKITPKVITKLRDKRLRKEYAIDIDNIESKIFQETVRKLLKDKGKVQYVSFTSNMWKNIKNKEVTFFDDKNKCLRYAMQFLFSSSYKEVLCQMFGMEAFCKILEIMIKKLNDSEFGKKVENKVKVELWMNGNSGLMVKFDVEQRESDEMNKLKHGLADMSWLTKEELVDFFYPTLLLVVGVSVLTKNVVPIESADAMLCYSNWNIGLG